MGTKKKMRVAPNFDDEPVAFALWLIEQELGEALEGGVRGLKRAAWVAVERATAALDEFEAEKRSEDEGAAEWRPKPSSLPYFRAERDEWLYMAYSRGDKLEDMLAFVNAQVHWQALKTRAAAMKAARRYAEKKRLKWLRRKNWSRQRKRRR